MKNLKLTPVSILLLSSLSFAAFAHSGATGIVKERMIGMMAMGKQLKVISDNVSGKVPYSGAAVGNAAIEIQNHAGQNMVALFPQGSLQHASEAREEIWSKPERFIELAEKLEFYAKGLEAAAQNGPGMGISSSLVPDSVEDMSQMPASDVFRLVGQTCTACHSDYRIKK